MRILIFGDSVPYGAWDTEGGWADRLKRELHRQYVSSGGKVMHEVLNLGVGADTSSHIRDRLRTEIEFRNRGSSDIILIFAFTINDTKINNGDVKTSAQRFKENIHDIAAIAQAYADRIVFVGSHPISQPNLVIGHNEFNDSLVEQYDKELALIVEKAGLLYIRPVFEDHGLEGLYALDGLHPKDEGHQLIFDAVWPEIDKLLP
jgi:lysophospholipase L1-like esterase